MSASDSLGQNPSTSAMSHSASALSSSSLSSSTMSDRTVSERTVSDRTVIDRTADRFEGMLATAAASPFFMAGAAMTIALGIVGVLVAGR